jgi:hypothetical protein
MAASNVIRVWWSFGKNLRRVPIEQLKHTLANLLIPGA